MTSSKRDIKQVTNLDYLIDLAKGNTQFIKEMIDTFILEIPKELAALEKAIHEKDFEAIRQTAHLMQSTIPFVGLDKILESEVYEIEKIAGDNSMLRKIEILPADKSVIQKIEIVAADKPALQKIESLFVEVKEICERACKELADSSHLQLSLK